MTLYQETVSNLVPRIRSGEITSEELVQECIERTRATEDTIQAWAYLDEVEALNQARALDELRRSGRPIGPLHGIPVGLSDNFDTPDMPSEYRSNIHSSFQPVADATVTARLREAGALIMGKTQTTEFDVSASNKTTNPHDPAHSTGNSSPGSAAAVAAGHVPIALGSEVSGSIIQSASFCGIYGMKPSRGMISRSGMMYSSQSLEQIGGFGRSINDLALLVDALSGYDAADDATYPRAKPRLTEGFMSEVPVEPNFLWFEIPFEEHLSTDSRTEFDKLRESLGNSLDTMALPEGLGNIIGHHKVIREYELSQKLNSKIRDNLDQLSPSLLNVVERGSIIKHDDYVDSLAAMSAAATFFAELFCDYDAILTPSANGEAPGLSEQVNNSDHCVMWSFCGLPSISIPLLNGTNGLPIGLQLVAGLEEDDRLCRSARWFLKLWAEDEV